MWLVAVHSLFEQCLLCLREWDLFFSREKRSFRYKNIIFLRYFFSVWSFSMFECEFVVVKPITCLLVCVSPKTRPKNEVRVPVLVWRGAHPRARLGECVFVRRSRLLRNACCVPLSSMLCKCVGWYMFYFFLFFFLPYKRCFLI